MAEISTATQIAATLRTRYLSAPVLNKGVLAVAAHSNAQILFHGLSTIASPFVSFVPGNGNKQY